MPRVPYKLPPETVSNLITIPLEGAQASDHRIHPLRRMDQTLPSQCLPKLCLNHSKIEQTPNQSSPYVRNKKYRYKKEIHWVNLEANKTKVLTLRHLQTTMSSTKLLFPEQNGGYLQRASVSLREPQKHQKLEAIDCFAPTLCQHGHLPLVASLRTCLLFQIP